MRPSRSTSLTQSLLPSIRWRPSSSKGGSPTIIDSAERTDDVGQGGDEAVFVERLAECWNVCRDVVSQKVIAVTGDEHEWQPTAGCAHLLAQLQSVQTWQPDIQDDAVEAVAVAGKFFSGGKEPDLMAHRAKKPVQSGAHIDVVIDDGEVHGGGVYHQRS